MATVVGHETGNAGLAGDAVDALTVGIAGGQGFLHVDGFSRAHGHDGIGGMGGGRCGDVDGVHLGVVHQFLCIGVPVGDVVAFGIGLYLFCVTAHDGMYAASLDETEGGAALLLGDFAAANEAPFYLFPCFH